MLVDDIYGAPIEWGKTVLESTLDTGLRALWLVIDVSFFRDPAKTAVNRMASAPGHELEPHGGTAVAVTPGRLRSEARLDAYRVTEEN
ncbi:hypothetical protein [Amycolatopsis decaplanina]|uniref:Oxidoreductase n=1 Tax=Amycolatopsis decaplanina DSM 44594 TaxID=1284240 RepID=M2ZWN1_9PSEU|nr:hypothetical protein [Amycolatopsis decaplanina]EME64764.1 oxidoreductase [Amycolatopsis decaplanina DSM 44594]